MQDRFSPGRLRAYRFRNGWAPVFQQENMAYYEQRQIMDNPLVTL
jgi:hypothetical protein